jgi:uncharacterized protein (DUF433 family)
MAAAVQTTYAHITKQAGVCGGKAAIDDTRVRVADVAWLHREGRSPDQILTEYPQLSLAQVHAALAYYYDHRDEVEATLAADETAEAEFERVKAEILSRKQRP